MLRTWKTNGSGLKIGFHSEEPLLLHLLRGSFSTFKNWLIWMLLPAWKLIEQQENAWVQVWHTKQGVSRKKLPPDVRDNAMRGPR